MRTQKISIKSIVEDFIDFTGEDLEVDENLIYKFADDAVSRIIDAEQFVFGIYLLPVKNYSATLPKGFKFVAQAAYRDQTPTPQLREKIIQWNQPLLEGDCTLVTNLECTSCEETPIIVSDVNRIYESAHPELYTQDMFHFLGTGGTTQRGTCSRYSDQFLLMRPATSNFQNIPMHVSECPNLRVESEIEYSITPPMINVNFKEGEILLACFTEDLDEDGYRRIPNVPIVFEAINRFIEERLAYIRYRKSGQQADANFYQLALQLKEQSIGRARSELAIPSAVEFKAFIDSYWRRVLPYNNYEENMGRYQKDPFHRGLYNWSPNRGNRYNR